MKQRRVKSPGMPRVFVKLEVESRLRKETNDCGVKAVALCANVDYGTAHMLLKAEGRKPRKGTNIVYMIRVLKRLGCEFPQGDDILQGMSNVGLMRKKHLEIHGPKHTPKNLTPYQCSLFPKTWKDGKTYLAVTNSHAFVIRNGLVLDWTHNRSNFIKFLWEIKTPERD